MKHRVPYMIAGAVTVLVVITAAFRPTVSNIFHIVAASQSQNTVSKVDNTGDDRQLDLSQITGEEVRSPGVEALEIHWRPFPRADFPRAPTFEENYKILRDHAEAGDGVSALILHGIINMCTSAFNSEVELENAIDRLQQTHTLQLPNMQTPVPLDDPENVPLFVGRMKSQFQDCSTLNTKQKSEADQWLRLAAERRISPAMIEYGNLIADSTEAMKWFKGAWDEGDTEGLLLMSRVYDSDYQSGKNPADNVNSYASLLAYSKLIEAGMGGADHGPIAHQEVHRVKQMLVEAKLQLNLQEHNLIAAIALSQEIIKSNPNCCFEM